MKEYLEIYSNEGENVGNIDKKEHHEELRKEFFEKGETSTRHKHVRLLLMTSNGRVILQRRSKWKGDNAGLWDKTIGGHVTENDSYDLTMLKECAEELGIPATIVKSDEFEKTVSVTDLTVLGVLTELQYWDNYKSKRKEKDDKIWEEKGMCTFYIGYYNGGIRFMDDESCGIQVFSKEELIDEMEKYPDTFTDDIHYIIIKFKDKIKPAPSKRIHALND